jgi:hypothetical protein
VFRNGATIEYREASVDTVLRLGNATEVLRAEAKSEARQQRLAAERAVDSVLADSFPASDPPSWTLGITRPQPELQVTSDDIVVPDERRAALARLLVPFAILLIGTLIALGVRGVIEAASWLVALIVG